MADIFHCFLSNVLDVYDSRFVKQLIERLNTMEVQQKRLVVFHGRRRRMRQGDVNIEVTEAMKRSLVVAPIVSLNSLQSMETLDVSASCDDVLLEWSLALFMHEHFQTKIFPVCLGSDVFAETLLDSIPDEVASSVIKRMEVFAKKHGWELSSKCKTRTARQVVAEILRFPGVVAWDCSNDQPGPDGLGGLHDLVASELVNAVERKILSESSESGRLSQEGGTDAKTAGSFEPASRVAGPFVQDRLSEFQALQGTLFREWMQKQGSIHQEAIEQQAKLQREAMEQQTKLYSAVVDQLMHDARYQGSVAQSHVTNDHAKSSSDVSSAIHSSLDNRSGNCKMSFKREEFEQIIRVACPGINAREKIALYGDQLVIDAQDFFEWLDLDRAETSRASTNGSGANKARSPPRGSALKALRAAGATPQPSPRRQLDCQLDAPTNGAKASKSAASKILHRHSTFTEEQLIRVLVAACPEMSEDDARRTIALYGGSPVNAQEFFAWLYNE